MKLHPFLQLLLKIDNFLLYQWQIFKLNSFKCLCLRVELFLWEISLKQWKSKQSLWPIKISNRLSNLRNPKKNPWIIGQMQTNWRKIKHLDQLVFQINRHLLIPSHRNHLRKPCRRNKVVDLFILSITKVTFRLKDTVNYTQPQAQRLRKIHKACWATQLLLIATKPEKIAHQPMILVHQQELNMRKRTTRKQLGKFQLVTT